MGSYSGSKKNFCFALSIVCAISILMISAAAVSAQTFSPTGSMSISRLDATATLLLNGRVLVAGGNDGTGLTRGTAELYNQATGTFTATGSMAMARQFHTATLLTNGKVLMAGGISNNGNPSPPVTATAELYNPSTGTFTSTGSMSVSRLYHTATLLCSGRVLITGGDTTTASGVGTEASSSAEIYDPATGAFTPTGNMVNGRNNHTATLLPDCKVLIAGGSAPSAPGGPDNPVGLTAELYDPSTGTFTSTGSMTTGRWYHTATSLLDGRVLVAGGFSPQAPDTFTNTAEIYDPSSGSFTSAGNMVNERTRHIAALLANGQVLVAGGDAINSSSSDASLDQAELFDPSTNSFTETGSMTQARDQFVASRLNNGLVLVTGGYSQTSDLYTPATMPVAKIISPVNNSVVQNTVIISTTVSPKVQWINLYVDGNYITSSPPYNFPWDSTTVANGSHTISIEAFSSSSGSRTEVGSDSITVDVKNGTITSSPTITATRTPTPIPPTPTGTPTPIPPTPTVTPTPIPPTPTGTPTPASGPVTITSPSNGATVSGTVSIVTTKSSKVQWENIYIDGNYLASSPPTTFSWDSTTVSNGNHTISAKGFNSSRTVVGKASVTVNVQN